MQPKPPNLRLLADLAPARGKDVLAPALGESRKYECGRLPRARQRFSISACAASPSGTARGPVLPSLKRMASSPTSRQRRFSISLLRHPVNASRRIAATNSGHSASRASDVRPNRPSSCVSRNLATGSMHERPSSTLWRNSGLWARLGASVDLPRGFTVGVSGELLRTRYEGNWSPFAPRGNSRSDRTRVLRASVLNRSFTVFGFSPKLVLVNETRESNAQLYDYRRNRTELQFVRQF